MEQNQKITDTALSTPILKELTTAEEFNKYFFTLQKEIGWNTCPTDGDLYMKSTNTKGFYAGFMDDEFFCTFCLIDYPDVKQVFFGMYVCVEKYKGRGLTFPLFKEKYDYYMSQGYGVFLTASDIMTDNYIKNLGVQNFGTSERLGVKKADMKITLDLKHPKYDKKIKKGADVDFQKLVEYDRKACGYDRKDSVKALTEIQDITCLVFEENGEIKGYGAIRKAVNGHKLCPLIADSQEIALALIKSLSEGFDSEIMLEIDHPHLKENRKTVGLCLQTVGFKLVKGFAILAHSKPLNDFSRTYSFYSIDIGL